MLAVHGTAFMRGKFGVVYVSMRVEFCMCIVLFIVLGGLTEYLAGRECCRGGKNNFENHLLLYWYTF